VRTRFQETVELPKQLRLSYAEKGDTEGIPVIFLHGFLDFWRSFARVLPYLPESIHAFACRVHLAKSFVGDDCPHIAFDLFQPTCSGRGPLVKGRDVGLEIEQGRSVQNIHIFDMQDVVFDSNQPDYR
jgi:hypothetical protein